jgi:hypothetical protein
VKGRLCVVLLGVKPYVVAPRWSAPDAQKRMLFVYEVSETANAATVINRLCTSSSGLRTYFGRAGGWQTGGGRGRERVGV